MTLKKAIAAALIVASSLGVTACTDEDGDGAVTDEEVGQIDEFVEDLGDDIEQEIQEGEEEVTE